MNPITNVETFFSVGGNAQVLDKAEGIAKVFFLNYDQEGRSSFSITVQGKKLIFPTSPSPSQANNIKWFGSQLFTFEKVQSSFLKIQERDDKGSITTVYVDLNKNETFCDVYKRLPKEITYAEALKKIEGIDTKKVTLLFNRHGTALIAYEQEYVLYFALPDEERVSKIKLSSKQVLRDSDLSFKSEDGFINIRQLESNLPKINDEEAPYVHFYNNQPGQLVTSLPKKEAPKVNRATLLGYLKQIQP